MRLNHKGVLVPLSQDSPSERWAVPLGAGAPTSAWLPWNWL